LVWPSCGMHAHTMVLGVCLGAVPSRYMSLHREVRCPNSHTEQSRATARAEQSGHCPSKVCMCNDRGPQLKIPDRFRVMSIRRSLHELTCGGASGASHAVPCRAQGGCPRVTTPNERHSLLRLTAHLICTSGECVAWRGMNMDACNFTCK
jgi:hypothetical protein